MEVGRCKHGKHEEDACADLSYRTWVFDNINRNSALGETSSEELLRGTRYEDKSGAMALTALGDVTDQIDDHDLIAILDWTPGSSRRSFGLPWTRYTPHDLSAMAFRCLVPLGATH